MTFRSASVVVRDEVTRTDGTTVDVRLDENFRKVVIEGDSEQG